MKKIISFIYFSLFLCIVSFAQNQQNQNEGKTPEERANFHAQRLTKELTLTADQTAKVKTILLNHEKQREAIRVKYKDAADKSPMKQEMKTLHEQKDAELKQVFSADQYTKYQADKEQHKGGGKNGGQHGQGQHHEHNK